MDLVTNIYKITQASPKEGIYGLTSLIGRYSISIPSNIAEGFGRKTKSDFVRFSKISMGVLSEPQNQLRISRNIGFFEESEFNSLFEETWRNRKDAFFISTTEN